ncbi:unnamed protein product [Cuscuta campestris]|uniref:DUF4228 domain-containing protein n=1 Tax=Cuscuta campestris TaxID=132261 RepID=A0A484L615_9ASTE|nr:unnamed protein product [Cuscuta campestris]
MGNTLRCCLACVLPFGALDLIRIVHLNGQIEEITHPVTAGEVLGNYPNHVLTKPAADQGVVRRILILSPSSELKRGTIYFLIPASSLPQQHQKKKHAAAAAGLISRNRKELSSRHNDDDDSSNSGNESWTEKKKPSPSQRHRRSGRVVGEWRPHLASISEN